jgi:ketosteroid isomerase-like protein
MTLESLQEAWSQDEMDIRALIEGWARTVREENREGIRADHDPEMLMFDVPPPFLSRGLDAYMATWEAFLSWSEKPVAFDFHDVKITAGKDVAFATATGRCAGVDPNGDRAVRGRRPERLPGRARISIDPVSPKDGWSASHCS